MSTITEVHNYTSDDRSEQAIWNVRPKQRSGDTTPIQLDYMPLKVYPEVSLKYQVDVEFCKKELEEFLSRNDYNVTRIMIGGWLAKVFDNPYEYPMWRKWAEYDLGRANDFLEPFMERFPTISKADLFQLAAWAFVKLAGGGDIPFHPGRKDKDEPSNSEESFCFLPYTTPGNVFPKTRQLSNKELLIFYCSHYSMGDIDEKGSRIESPLTSKPRIDNSYCKELLTRRKEGHLLSPTDKKFLQDPVLHFLVRKYAADLNVFLADFTQAFVRLSELEFAVV